MASPCRVLLVPFPITPLSAFGYFLYRNLGIVDAEVGIHYHRSSTVPVAAVEMGGGVIHNFATSDLSTHLETVISEHHNWEHQWWLLRRLLSFCKSGDSANGKRMLRWLIGLSISLDDPKLVLERTERFFVACLEQKLDLWEVGFSAPEEVQEPTLPMIPGMKRTIDAILSMIRRARWITHQIGRRISVSRRQRPFAPTVLAGDKRIVTLPIFKTHKPGEKEVVAAARFELIERRGWELQSSHIGVVIGGPAGSGKSTLAVSLAAEMRNILDSLATRSGWDGFSLTSELVTLDLATPTTEAIQTGTGKDRAGLETLKRPWTVDLAFQAQLRFQEAKMRSNLVFADLPGGKVDTITEITASLADVAILVTNDWSKMPEWRTFAQRMGIRVVSEARSHLSNEQFSSVVTTYRPGRFIAGRVTDLDRVGRSWDRFVSWLAEFLLFDILPTLQEERRARLRGLLAELWQPPK